jgi:glycine/D-amino acid oxidase-like deaminating enzyme/nitrite reductase/ring-hydroxylating ferredoxin subunit
MRRDGNLQSLWQDTTPDYHLKGRAPGKMFDVIIAGGGMTGITTGLLLQKAGKSVMIAEAQNIGFGTSGGTTAHLNTFLDTPYPTIQRNFGENDAQLVAKSAAQALALIRGNIHNYNIDCGYKELPGYLFSQDEKQTKELEEIFKASEECGVAVAWSDTLPLPIPFEKVLRFDGQATFHPTRYLTALAKVFEEAGGIIVEDCRVIGVEEGDTHTVKTNKGNFNCSHFIYATHIPPGVNLLHFRCAPYRSYAMAVQLPDIKKYDDALVYDMYDPYHYYRSQEIDGQTYFIAGGEDHKTGHGDNTKKCFRNLQAHLEKYFTIETVVNSWSSQYFEPNDGLPYIGNLPGHRENMFVATGFGGNGMVYSNVAAITLTEMITGQQSELEDLYDPNRIKIVAGFSNLVKESADVVGKLLGKLVPAEKLQSLSDLAPGEARVVNFEDHRLAIYKDEDGQVYALNSACTHIKCDVSWNNAEKTWDCPCHGSRFSYTGEMVTAPARKDLEVVKIVKEEPVHNN